jgi:hypothetical protein
MYIYHRPTDSKTTNEIVAAPPSLPLIFFLLILPSTRERNCPFRPGAPLPVRLAHLARVPHSTPLPAPPPIPRPRRGCDPPSGRGVADAERLGRLLRAARGQVRAGWSQQGIWRDGFEGWMGRLARRGGGIGGNSLGMEDAGVSSKRGRAGRVRANAKARASVRAPPAGMFAWEVEREEERIRQRCRAQQGECGRGGETNEAYWTVRRRWEERHIWFPGWTAWPGRRWGHEISVEEWYRYASVGEDQAGYEIMESGIGAARGAIKGPMQRYRQGA